MSWQKSWSATIWRPGTAAESCGWGCWPICPTGIPPWGRRGGAGSGRPGGGGPPTRKYGGGSHLFSGDPVTVPRGWALDGWERKRGALVELVRLLKDRPSGLEVLSGDRGALADTRYVITLDSDTSLNVGAARELVVQRPSSPESAGGGPAGAWVVTEGYALLQPRVAVELAAANRSLVLSRVFAGLGEWTPMAARPACTTTCLTRGPIRERASSR